MVIMALAVHLDIIFPASLSGEGLFSNSAYMRRASQRKKRIEFHAVGKSHRVYCVPR